MSILHEVRQGECLSSIAKQYRFLDYRTIYDHAENRDFRQKRPNPNVICPGDKISIPDRKTKQAGCQTGKAHRFITKSPATVLRLVLHDEQGKPVKSARYRLLLPAAEIAGVTDTDGLILQKIPHDLEEALLEVEIPDANGETHLEQWSLNLGHLDPVDEPAGIQARLNNLGFDCGSVDGIIGPKTESAIRRFQKWVGLPVDGAISPQTRAKLEAAHQS